MSINPNNYTGVNATIVGRTAAPAENPPYDKTGERGFQQIRVAVDQGYKDRDGNWVETQTLWITYSGKAADLAQVSKGDKVRLDDVKLEAREFERKDGTTGQAFEARFGTLTVLENAGGGGSADADAPF